MSFKQEANLWLGNNPPGNRTSMTTNGERHVVLMFAEWLDLQEERKKNHTQPVENQS